MQGAGDSGWKHQPERGGRAPDARGLVVSALFFFPRGGSAQVTRSLARAQPAAGWQPTLAAGSLGQAGEPTHAASFFAGIDVHALDYSPALELAEPLAAPVPFQPSYEDRPEAPDRVFAAVDEAAYERLVAAWIALLARAGAGAADLLHLHHLTPANEAAARGFPSLPALGQLHGTELAMLRMIEAGAPPGWRYAQDWGRRLRAWAQRCALLVVPPGAEGDAALLLGLERAKLRGLPSGVELERFSPQPLAQEERLAFWRRWLVEQPCGWDESGRPGSIAYRDEELASFRAAEERRVGQHNQLASTFFRDPAHEVVDVGTEEGLASRHVEALDSDLQRLVDDAAQRRCGKTLRPVRRGAHEAMAARQVAGVVRMEPELLEPIGSDVPAATLVRRAREGLGAEKAGSEARLEEVMDVQPCLARLETAGVAVGGDELAEGPSVHLPEEPGAAVVHGHPVRSLGVEEKIDLAVPIDMGRRRVNDRPLRKMRHAFSPWLHGSRMA